MVQPADLPADPDVWYLAMVLSDSFLTARPRPSRRYVRAPSLVHFAESAEVPETGVHLELRTALYLLVRDFVAERGAVGSEQFVYWDPTDPRACLAPDAFVYFGEADHLFRSWKTWEHGVPQVAVEVISDSDQPAWAEKLVRYRRLGVSELVWFDPEVQQRPLRVWDRSGDHLVERQLVNMRTKCAHLGGYWCAVECPDTGLTLRLSRDELGTQLFPTSAELAVEARQRAEQRVRELEAELQRRTP